MDLRQLRYFKVLAAHQHFGRAAMVLHIAQPALSRQVQLLESELGVRLVNRHSRGASLTREGELLLDRATFLLRYTDQIKVDIADLGSTPRGPVALGVPPAFASVIALPLVRGLRARYPDVQLRLTESFSPALCEALEQGSIDIAVLSGPLVATPLVHAEPLVTEKICAIGAANDQRLANGHLTVNQLENVPLILAGMPNSGVRLALERTTAEANVDLRIVAEVESATVATQLVADGMGWTIHYGSAVAQEVADGRLRAAPIEGLVLERYVAHAVTRPPSGATVSLITLIYDTVGSMISDGRWPMAEVGVTEK
ncbi:LysR family transcriptional regulator [Paraburkholderia caribensis]|uniref:LysR family transcriptional regulator n=1 Tax=Paraburkholderia caribensis TaxID=75105 RepID=UPI001CB53ADF|nr:LysR substrate-binding domain-containing protein [Paraburkholderia caribensis]CAG9243875.1 LysR family transcriptional regulator [Paraburkholderia caribensis]